MPRIIQTEAGGGEKNRSTGRESGNTGVIIAILGRNDRRIYSIIRKEQDMYNILLKMKTKFEQEQWLKMVDQAKTRGKLTDEEYKKLTETE